MADNNDAREHLLHDLAEQYEPVPSLQELESEARPPRTPAEWDHIQNLDAFFIRIYKFYEEKGLWCILTARTLNILTLGFTIAFSGFLLLFVNWHAVTVGCAVEDDCDFIQLAVYDQPLQHSSRLTSGLVLIYLGVFSLYWVWTVLRFLLEIRPLVEIHRFCVLKLGLETREMQTMGWSELVHRIVLAQASMRLCVVKELTELDIVSRIMRKENYLIAMLNKKVLNLQLPFPGMRKHVMMTKILEWNLYWCILDVMFDDNFLVRREFLRDERALRQRVRVMALCNVVVSPFLLLFLLVFFFLRNAEAIYHQPSSIGTRHWSALAQWKLRHFNELPHLLTERLNQSYPLAVRYVAQFPSPFVSMVAKFVAFIVGAFAAAIIGLALVDERLLEAHVHGRKLVWYAAIFGTVLAVSRAMITAEHKVFCPEAAMQDVVKYTNYFPKAWRNRCHQKAVQKEFEALFPYKAGLFLEEMLSIVLTPLVLWCSLPQSAGAVLAFVRDFTVRIDGVGDVCSLSVFDFGKHGNAKYGSPVHCPKELRSHQGKMEKSFLSFTALYHNWEPEASGRAVLANVRDFQPDPSSGASQLIESQLWGSVLPHLNPAFGPYEPITLPAAAATTTLSPSSQAASGASLHLETSGGALASSGLVAAKCEADMYRSQLALQGFYSAHAAQAGHPPQRAPPPGLSRLGLGSRAALIGAPGQLPAAALAVVGCCPASTGAGVAENAAAAAPGGGVGDEGDGAGAGMGGSAVDSVCGAEISPGTQRLTQHALRLSNPADLSLDSL